MDLGDRLGSCNVIDLRHIDMEALQLEIMGNFETYYSLPAEERYELRVRYEETLQEMIDAVKTTGEKGEPCREMEKPERFDDIYAIITNPETQVTPGWAEEARNSIEEYIRKHHPELAEDAPEEVFTETAPEPDTGEIQIPVATPLPLPRR